MFWLHVMTVGKHIFSWCCLFPHNSHITTINIEIPIKHSLNCIKSSLRTKNIKSQFLSLTALATLEMSAGSHEFQIIWLQL